MNSSTKPGQSALALPKPEDIPRQFLYELANLHRKKGAMQRFKLKWERIVGKYGDEHVFQRRDELRMLWGSCCRLPGDIPELARPVYLRWRSANAGESLEEFLCNYWLRLERG